MARGRTPLSTLQSSHLDFACLVADKTNKNVVVSYLFSIEPHTSSLVDNDEERLFRFVVVVVVVTAVLFILTPANSLRRFFVVVAVILTASEQ